MTQPETDRSEEEGGPGNRPVMMPGVLVQPVLAGEEDFRDLRENLERGRGTWWTSLLLTAGYVIGTLAAVACAVALYYWMKR